MSKREISVSVPGETDPAERKFYPDTAPAPAPRESALLNEYATPDAELPNDYEVDPATIPYGQTVFTRQGWLVSTAPPRPTWGAKDVCSKKQLKNTLLAPTKVFKDPKQFLKVNLLGPLGANKEQAHTLNEEQQAVVDQQAAVQTANLELAAQRRRRRLGSLVTTSRSVLGAPTGATGAPSSRSAMSAGGSVGGVGGMGGSGVGAGYNIGLGSALTGRFY